MKTSKTLTVLKRTTMPALLIVVGFITNTKDNSILDNNMNEIINTIAEGFLESRGLLFKPVKVE